MTDATPPVSGTGEVTPQVPGRQDMEAAVQVIHDNADRLFLWDYERDRGQLVTLYNKAMGSQWNSVTDLDWSIDVDPERLVAEQDSPLLAVARVAGTLPGSPLATWTEKEYIAARDRDVQGEPLAVHARRAGRHDDRGQDRRDRAVDRRQVLRVDPDHGRGPAHRGVRQVSPHQAGRRLPDEPVPQGADLVAARGLPLGHRLPGDADRHRVAGAGRLRRHAAAHRGAAC